jgi:hypothetical protein
MAISPCPSLGLNPGRTVLSGLFLPKKLLKFVITIFKKLKLEI